MPWLTHVQMPSFGRAAMRGAVGAVGAADAALVVAPAATLAAQH
jgi:hypothetical protein